jgi:hypothetical protein
LAELLLVNRTLLMIADLPAETEWSVPVLKPMFPTASGLMMNAILISFATSS